MLYMRSVKVFDAGMLGSPNALASKNGPCSVITGAWRIQGREPSGHRSKGEDSVVEPGLENGLPLRLSDGWSGASIQSHSIHPLSCGIQESTPWFHAC